MRIGRDNSNKGERAINMHEEKKGMGQGESLVTAYKRY